MTQKTKLSDLDSPAFDSNEPSCKGLKAFKMTDYLKFLVPSLLGISLFLVPLTSSEGRLTIGMGVMADWLRALMKAQLPMLATLMIVASSLLTLLVSYHPVLAKKDSPLFRIFQVSPIWQLLRLIGALFAVLTLFHVGPEWVWSKNTGGVVLLGLAPVLITFFLFAAILLPFLVDFGFMEFIGVLTRNFFQSVFRLPGRASIDAVASWLGAAPVGVLITTQQYESGFYSKREAAVIATNFSIASIAFSFLIADFIGISHYFIPFYLTVCFASFVAAIITPRLPPLCWKKDEYYEPAGKQIKEDIPSHRSAFSWAIEQAVTRAKNSPPLVQVFKAGLFNVLDIWFGLLPLVVAIGIAALALSDTPVFAFLSQPIVPLLEMLKIPEAQAAAPAFLVGFADMFLPAVLGQSIESELTRFIIAVVSMCQLIYMSEVGILLIKSKIPINFIELFAIFIIRTLITLPLVALVAHFIVF